MKLEVLQLLVGKLMLETLQLQGDLEESQKSLESLKDMVKGLLVKSTVLTPPLTSGEELAATDSPSPGQ